MAPVKALKCPAIRYANNYVGETLEEGGGHEGYLSTLCDGAANNSYRRLRLVYIGFGRSGLIQLVMELSFFLPAN